jgi:cation diffusion facilitator CzcD-associated flavoprotein CzcO
MIIDDPPWRCVPVTVSQTTAPQTAASEGVRDAGHTDFLIIGAGISGIDAAHHMRERFPDRSLLILEAKDGHGGTWWTHRYPGVRSDSDLFTYGYRFKPWRGPAIASGSAILDYLDELVAEEHLDEHIRYQHRVTSASWSTEDRRWTVDVTETGTGNRLRFTASFLWMCPGYYDHDQPHRPAWDGLNQYRGLVVHPQNWPEDLDLAGKRVIVIGSGATAATLVPAIAQDAAHVTMVQRSPSYFFSPPRQNELAQTLQSLDIPAEWTHEILRRSYIANSDTLVKTARDAPDELHKFFVESMRPQLPEGFDIDRHFTPRYRPWQQRIGIVADGDFFTALRSGKASIVTDTIDTFTPDGLRVSSGEEIPADIVVTATGFTMSLFGGISFTVDGEPVDFTSRVTWRGLMISGVPSMAYVFGYLRYSWTLRADLVCDLVGRMLSAMADRGTTMVTPTLRPSDASMELRPFCDPGNFSAGYIMRTQDALFRQGDREPWTHLHEYFEERDTLPAADLDDGTLVYR